LHVYPCKEFFYRALWLNDDCTKTLLKLNYNKISIISSWDEVLSCHHECLLRVCTIEHPLLNWRWIKDTSCGKVHISIHCLSLHIVGPNFDATMVEQSLIDTYLNASRPQFRIWGFDDSWTQVHVKSSYSFDNWVTTSRLMLYLR